MKTRYATLISLAFALLLGGCFQDPQYVHVGPNWARLNDMKPGENSFKVKILSASKKAALGEPMQFTLTSERAGQLWVVQVDPKDELSLLFPNKLQPDNQIPANVEVSVPAADGGWSLEASEPAGLSAVAFIVTPKGVSLEDALGNADNSKRMEKAISIVGQAPAWGLAKTVIEVVDPSSN